MQLTVIVFGQYSLYRAIADGALQGEDTGATKYVHWHSRRRFYHFSAQRFLGVERHILMVGFAAVCCGWPDCCWWSRSIAIVVLSARYGAMLDAGGIEA